MAHPCHFSVVQTHVLSCHILFMSSFMNWIFILCKVSVYKCNNCYIFNFACFKYRVSRPTHSLRLSHCRWQSLSLTFKFYTSEYTPCLNLNNDAYTKCNILYFKIKTSIHISIRRLLTVLYGNSNTNDMRIT